MRLVPLLALLVALAPRAQEADTLTAADGWRSSLVATLAGNQASFSNWQEGGVDALSGTASVDGTFDRVVGDFLTEQTLRLVIGVQKQDTLDVRKAIDVARYEASAEVISERVFRPALAVLFRTQFAPGFDYTPTAEEYPSLVVVPGEELKVSDAFAPLVMSQSLGLAVRPGGGAFLRMGVALKETVVGIERLRPVHGNALDQPVRVQAGVDGEAGIDRKIMDNVRLQSRLSMFQAFGQVANQAPDVLFETVLLLKVNSLLNVRVDAAVAYDADVSADVQLREVLALGVSVPIL
ncbi:DUF3078 domain-containing protein [Rubrivirga marina]|uniref:DUF3078 domain-containing protein n=1 Tax=Rubrivirga marina TaxID=1196024 RepID=A0A271J1M7_9BACT|nr:DUF3078 domain-containing protein [Rubrivirga marina]PAP77416.1 hypothetical protein BSZ37_13705 [Rubrivirga marina]